MNISEIWIRRPVMTTLVMLGLLFFGFLSYEQLPINNLPAVDFPTINVRASLPGASPETMAATVATPLEKQFSSISGIDSMSSTSTQGNTSINIQFSLERDIDAAALDVNSAISAAMGVLPRNMPNPPVYKKINPSDMPIIMIAFTSDTLPLSTLNDLAENILIANLSSINGIAEVDIVGAQKYAVRVQVNPHVLTNRGIGINEVASAIQNGNVNLPGGKLDGPFTSYTIDSNGQLFNAEGYNSLIITYQDGYPVRIRDVGRAIDSVENDKQLGLYLKEGRLKETIILRVRKQPGANIVLLANEIKARLPKLEASLPGAASVEIFYDQSEFIEESIMDVQYTMILTIFLVILVIFLFIRAIKPTLIPSLVVPLSIIATFPVISLLGYTLNNLSLMAITLSIGFVVDDAIVVIENIIRRIEMGESAMVASLKGSREIGFTILSMTLSLAVVFVPILFMSGIIGRLFREFAVCITVAILFSGFFSLTLTPMLSSRLLRGYSEKKRRGLYAFSERVFEGILKIYGWSLKWVIKGRIVMVLLTILVTVAMVQLFDMIPKGFIPNQDQNYFRIFTQVEDKTSFEDMFRHQEQMSRILLEHPDCKAEKIICIIGFGRENTAITFVALRPKEKREHSVDEIISALRPRLNQIPGLIVSLVNPPVINLGSRLTSAQWQFTLQSTDIDDLYNYGAVLEGKMKKIPALEDVKSDLHLSKPKLKIMVDREKASAHGLTLKQIQDTFYSAYGDRQISIIYTATNYYYVILELEPRFRQNPSALETLHIKSSNGKMVPLKAVAEIRDTVSPQSINHSGQIPSATISFNLKPGHSIGSVIEEVNHLAAETLPATVNTSFQGSAQAFQASFASLGFLLLVTILVIYVILGILYESFIHPLTILTALPLAGFGALAALLLFDLPLDMYAFVGIIMLVGIVKKNGIMMIDFALESERTQKLSSEESIYQACLIRFRPIMMTTMAALIGTLPIAIGFGAGAEARQPLGVAVVGGLFFSQFLTLFVTPVFYIYFDKFNRWLTRNRDSNIEESIHDL